MMPFDGPSFPAPPDPVTTANAQGQVNADTARLTQRMNLVDQVGPGYSIRYNRIGPDGQGTGVSVGGQGGAPATPYYGALPDGTPITQQNFNAQQYLLANPDVQAAFGQVGGEWLGSDPAAAAWRHYSQYGASEGRPLAPGAAPGSTQPAAHRLNLSGIDWSNANGVADMAYMGLPDRAQWDQVRRDAGFTGDFGNNNFENWLRGTANYNQQVDYINALAGRHADADYLRTLIGQLDAAPGLANPYSADNTDRWQQTISLDPEEQANYDLNRTLSNTMLGIAEGQANRVGNTLSTSLDLSGLPKTVSDIFGIGSIGGNAQLDNGVIDPYAGLGEKARFDALRRGLGYEGEFGGGAFENWLAQQNEGLKNRYVTELRAANADPDYLRQLGATADPLGALNSLRGRSETALFDRLNPQLQRDRIALEDRLRNQGVMPGSQAWAAALDDLNRGQNDARLAVTAQGGDELSRMFAIALQNANLSNAARNQLLQEQAYISNTPINQINALRSGSQVAMPQAYTPVPTQVQAANYQGAVYNSAELAQQQAIAQQQAQSAMMGDLFGLPTAALGGWGAGGFKKFW